MSKLFCFLLLGLASAVFSVDFHDFDCYQGKLSRSYVENKIGRYLQKDREIESYFSITDEALLLFDSPAAKKGGHAEYRLAFGPMNEPPIGMRKPLHGAKIAIDPGHLGGLYAHLEERFIDMDPYIQFDEGSLSFLTALHLKELLEQKGAIVLLTRDQIGKGVYEEDFFLWLSKQPHLWGTQKTLAQIFHSEYNPLDLQARAAKINQFQPDLTLIIHYNAHDSDPSSRPRISDKNFNLAFIPGAFCKGELAQQINRYAFMRLIVTSDLEQSAQLCREVIQQFVDHLKVPAVAEEEGISYLDHRCLKIDRGVYARNLSLTRRIFAPLCYGESLIQNYPEESVRLAQKDITIGGIPCSSRIKEVAEAYFAAICTYFSESGKPSGPGSTPSTSDDEVAKSPPPPP